MPENWNEKPQFSAVMEHATEPYIFPNLIINSTGNIGNSEITAFQQNKGCI